MKYPTFSEVSTWKDLRRPARKDRTPSRRGLRVPLATLTVTVSRWQICLTARSVSGTAKTAKARSSALHQANGTHSSEECETENSTISARHDRCAHGAVASCPCLRGQDSGEGPSEALRGLRYVRRLLSRGRGVNWWATRRCNQGAWILSVILNQYIQPIGMA
jgi:hypothetical protein